jgi:hypothetical protein
MVAVQLTQPTTPNRPYENEEIGLSASLSRLSPLLLFHLLFTLEEERQVVLDSVEPLRNPGGSGLSKSDMRFWYIGPLG